MIGHIIYEVVVTIAFLYSLVKLAQVEDREEAAVRKLNIVLKEYYQHGFETRKVVRSQAQLLEDIRIENADLHHRLDVNTRIQIETYRMKTAEFDAMYDAFAETLAYEGFKIEELSKALEGSKSC